MPPKRPLWQDWRLDADEQAEFRAELAAGDPEALERLEWLRAEARLAELSRQLGDWWAWQKLARKPAEFETRLKEVLAETEACVRELSDMPRTGGRPRSHSKRDTAIYSLRWALDTKTGRDGRVSFIQKKRTFGQIARMLKTRHGWDLDAKAVRQAYERELQRRKKRRAELDQRAAEALAEDT